MERANVVSSRLAPIHRTSAEPQTSKMESRVHFGGSRASGAARFERISGYFRMAWPLLSSIRMGDCCQPKKARARPTARAVETACPACGAVGRPVLDETIDAMLDPEIART